MKNVSSYQKRKIVEYLESKGYANRDNRKFSLYLDAGLMASWNGISM